MQLIQQIDQIFKQKKLNLWLRPYEILATGNRCGLIEVVSDALSIDSIKKKMDKNAQLIDYFTKQFGPKKSKRNFLSVIFRRLRESAGQLLQLFGSLLACVLRAAGEGPSQRQHSSGHRGAHHAHRLRLPALERPWQGHQARAGPLQAYVRHGRRARRHRLKEVP